MTQMTTRTTASESGVNLTVRLRNPHAKQRAFINSRAKRKVIRAGRRGGKTVGVALLAVKCFLAGKRVLYAVPTQEQIDRFWFEVKRALAEPLDAGILYKNETKHIIGFPEIETQIYNALDNPDDVDGVPGEETRIRAKTAWNADSLRGDYADKLILDEYQLMSEDAWELVGAPMLLDNDGDAVFVYTPPSARSRSVSKARDKLHAAKLYKKAIADETGRWEAFHFSSHENPHISKSALDEITSDMTALAYAQEILAEDKDDAPGALWSRDLLEKCRIERVPPLTRIVVALDPESTSSVESAETGIIAAGVGMCNCKGKGSELHAFVLEDGSLRATPMLWARQAIALFHKYHGDRLIGEINNGGEMIETTLRVVDPNIPYKEVRASRGKQTRAEPIVAKYEKGMVHHVGTFAELEDQQCNWVPNSGARSPDRLDADVWALTELLLDTHEQSAEATGNRVSFEEATQRLPAPMGLPTQSSSPHETELDWQKQIQRGQGVRQRSAPTPYAVVRKTPRRGI